MPAIARPEDYLSRGDALSHLFLRALSSQMKREAKAKERKQAKRIKQWSESVIKRCAAAAAGKPPAADSVLTWPHPHSMHHAASDVCDKLTDGATPRLSAVDETKLTSVDTCLQRRSKTSVCCPPGWSLKVRPASD